MHPFLQVWEFTRFRLDQALDGLNERQLNWRLYPEAHNIFEIVYHIAGCEHYWSARLSGREPAATQFEALLDQAVHDGFLREGVGGPFRSPEHLTPGALAEALRLTAGRLRPILSDPSPEVLAMPLTSPVGDAVTGEQGLARLVQHAGYHTGQIWLIAMSPHFPV